MQFISARAVITTLFFMTWLPGCASVLSATRDDDRATLQRLLRGGANPNQATENGVTPLFEAIAQNNLPLVKMLVDGGADVNKPSRCRGRDVAPLHKAAIHNQVALVKYLLDMGADPTGLVGGHDVFTLMATSRDAKDAARIASIILSHVEATKGHDAMLAFLDQRTPSGWTALTAAAFHGRGPLVETLLARGASFDTLAAAGGAIQGSGDELPPVTFAVLGRHPEIVSLLVRAGADPEQPSKEGYTSAEIVENIDRAYAETIARWDRERQAQAAQSQATFNAFQGGLQRGSTASAAPSNPVNDNGLQRRMAERARQSERRRASSPRPPSSSGEGRTAAAGSNESPTPGAAPGATPGATPSTGGAPSKPGSIIVSGTESTPAATPSAAPAPSASAAPFPTAQYTPPPAPVRDCQDVVDSGPVRGNPFSTREMAEANMRSRANSQCMGKQGGGVTVSGVSCTEKRQQVLEPVNGKIVRKEDKILYVCEGQYRCNNPREVCKQGDRPSGAVKQ